MWWAYAHSYFKNENFKKEESSYLSLYELIMKDSNRNITHLLKCKFKLAVVYKELKEFEAFKEQCDSILELSEKIELNDITEDIVTRTVELVEDYEDRLKN